MAHACSSTAAPETLSLHAVQLPEKTTAFASTEMVQHTLAPVVQTATQLQELQIHTDAGTERHAFGINALVQRHLTVCSYAWLLLSGILAHSHIAAHSLTRHGHAGRRQPAAHPHSTRSRFHQHAA
jgi:hypothetical protein